MQLASDVSDPITHDSRRDVQGPPAPTHSHGQEMAQVFSLPCGDENEDGGGGGSKASHSSGCKAPPPAYGSTKCSVRADPELLHWQAVPSPVMLGGEGDGLPSPGYEEVVREGEGVGGRARG